MRDCAAGEVDYDKKLTLVDLPPSATRSAKVLIADERNYVQTFREDKCTDVHRIDPDSKVTEVLHNAQWQQRSVHRSAIAAQRRLPERAPHSCGGGSGILLLGAHEVYAFSQTARSGA